MDLDLIEFEGGDVLANLEERTITGLLIPYGEEGRTNIGRFSVAAGDVALPADPAVIGINLDHARPDVVGRATRVWEEDRGVMATFAIARTPEGDAALADAVSPTGTRRKLSAEFGPAFIKAGRLVAGHARLWGSALVPAGAFPSAQVLAADTPDEDAPHLEVAADVLPADITVNTPAGDSAVYEPTAAPAEDTNTEGNPIVTDTTQEVLAGAPQPVAQAALIATTPAQATARPTDTRQVLAAIASYKANPGDEAARHVLAALVDIKITGAGSLPEGAGLQPNWVGELYSGVPYEREYIQLGTLGTNITAGGKKGFKINRGTAAAPIPGPGDIPNGGDWPGNKAEINSYAGFTTPNASTLRRFAVGHDIAREFYDLPGGEEYVAAFLQLVLEDHLFWSDTNALEDIVAAAGVPVAPGTFPSDYPASAGLLIQGILAVKARKADGRRDVPTFAIANEAAYEELVYAVGDDHLPEFVDIVVSTDSEGTVDGNVRVVQGDVGIENTPAVLVGASKAIEFDELPGGPVKVDALELAKGGIDRAVHGYLQTFVVRPQALVLVGVADVIAADEAKARK